MKKSETALRVLLLTTTLVAANGRHVVGVQEENRWESQIARFEAADRENPPAKHAILFVGSSSIRRWGVKKYFPGKQVINRGFGGSEVADSIHFADRIILPHAPRVVVVYAGDNDIARGKTAGRVVDDYKALVERIHGELPKARIVFIAIKPSLKRWELVETMRSANKSIREITENDDRLRFVDVDTPMIGEDGMPRKELFKEDGLHLNDKGYRLWTSLVMPHVSFH